MSGDSLPFIVGKKISFYTLIFLVNFLFNFAIQGSLIFMPLLGAQVGAADWQIGLAGTVYGLSYLCSSLYSGWQSDLKGRLPFVRTGLLICCLAFAAQLLIDNLTLLLVIRSAVGLSLGITSAALIAYAFEHRTDMGKFSSYGSLGWIGGAAGGALFKEFNILFTASAAACFLAFIFSLLFKETAAVPAGRVAGRGTTNRRENKRSDFNRQPGCIPQNSPHNNDRDTPQDISAPGDVCNESHQVKQVSPGQRIRQDGRSYWKKSGAKGGRFPEPEPHLLPVLRRNLRVYLAVFFRHLGATAVWLILPLYLSSLGLDRFWIGTLWGINFAVQFFVMRVLERFSPARTFALGQLLSIAVFVAYAFIKALPLLLIVQVFLGVAWSCLYVGALLLVLHSGEERGTASGIFQSTLNLCNALGPFLGGLIAEWYGYRGVMLFAAGLGVLGLAVAVPRAQKDGVKQAV